MGRESVQCKVAGESSNGNLQKNKKKIFLNRKKGLAKKFKEFKTLCDVEGCMILTGPNGEFDSTIPENRVDVEEILKRYNGINPVEREKRKLDLSNFFDVDGKPIKKKNKFTNNGKEKIEVSPKLMQKYPDWDERLDGLPKESLKHLENQLESMMEIMSEKERMLKRANNLLFNQQPLLPSGPTSHGPRMVLDDSRMVGGCVPFGSTSHGPRMVLDDSRMVGGCVPAVRVSHGPTMVFDESRMMGGCVRGVPCDPSLVRSMGNVYNCGYDQYYHHQMMMMVMNDNGFHQQQQWVDGPGSANIKAQMAPLPSSVSNTNKFYDQLIKVDSSINEDFAMIGQLNYYRDMGMISEPCGQL